MLGSFRSTRPGPTPAMTCWPDEGEMPWNGVVKAISSGIGYVPHNGATPVSVKC